MTAVADHKTVGAPFGNASQMVRVIYDFAADTGAAGAFDLMTTTDDIVITNFFIRGITVLDSAGDGVTIDVGISGGDTDILLNGIAEASFSAGAMLLAPVVEGAPNVFAMPLKLAAAEKIIATIIGEDLTSGKCEFFFEYQKFNA